MDYLTARIISEAGYGKLQDDVDKDLQQQILTNNKANQYNHVIQQWQIKASLENAVSLEKQNFTNLLQNTQSNPLAVASNVGPQAKENSTLQNLRRNVVNVNNNSLQPHMTAQT